MKMITRTVKETKIDYQALDAEGKEVHEASFIAVDFKKNLKKAARLAKEDCKEAGIETDEIQIIITRMHEKEVVYQLPVDLFIQYAHEYDEHYNEK